MKKIILTILLMSVIWSCDKKQNPIIDNTKSLQKKIDSLTVVRSKIDTVLKIQTVQKIKIVEMIKSMPPKGIDSTLVCRYKDSMNDVVKKQIVVDLTECDFIKKENENLYKIVKIEEIKNLIKDTIITKKDSTIFEKNEIIVNLKKQVVNEKTNKNLWKGGAIISILISIFR
jgi:hypothetical protein